jgi:dolichol kinase
MYITGAILKRNFEQNHPGKWNMLLTMIGFSGFTWLFILSIIDASHFDPLLVSPFDYYLCVFWFLWFFICFVYNESSKKIHNWLKLREKTNKSKILTILAPKIPKESKKKLFFDDKKVITQDSQKIPSTQEDLKKTSSRVKQSHPEIHRKIVHGAATLFVFTFVISPYLFSLVKTYVYYAYPEKYDIGIVGDLSNIQLARYGAIPILILVELAALLVEIDNEIFFNLWPEYDFPFKAIMERSLRDEERGTLASNVHMVLGFLIGTTILAYNQPIENMPLVINTISTMILVGIWGDLMACLFGKTWGKTKWKWYPKKSSLGSAAGMITTFLIAVWFIGVWGAIIAMIMFLFSDIPLSKWNICDNMSFPFFLGIILRIFWFALNPIFYMV